MNTIILNFFLDRYSSSRMSNKDIVETIDSYSKNRPEIFFLDLIRFLQLVDIKKWQITNVDKGWHILYTTISFDYYLAKKYFNEH